MSDNETFERLENILKHANPLHGLMMPGNDLANKTHIKRGRTDGTQHYKPILQNSTSRKQVNSYRPHKKA